MPKQKTHKGAAKRLKVTGAGKIRHERAWRGHNRHKKSARRWRRVAGEATLEGGDARRARRLLGRGVAKREGNRSPGPEEGSE